MSLIRDSVIALYRQIASELRDDITSGKFDPTGKLPSEAEIGAKFGVSRVTVRLALDHLAREGLIERRQGKGTFVAGKQVRHDLGTLRSFHESLLMQGLNATMRILTFGPAETPAEALDFFGLQSSFLERLHLVDGEPIALGRSYLPQSIAQLGRAEAERRPTYALLETLAKQRVARANVAIGATSVDDQLAGVLNAEAGGPLLVMERSSYFEDGSGAERSTFYVRPARYRFVFGSTFPASTTDTLFRTVQP